MTRATERKAQLVAAIERRLDAADDPLHVRVHEGRAQVGGRPLTVWAARRSLLWTDVPFISSFLLARGYGRVVEDDGVPF